MYLVKQQGGYWIGANKPPHPFLALQMTYTMARRIAENYGGTLVPFEG